MHWTELQREVAAAHARLAPILPPTPLLRSAWLSALTGGEIWLKLENVQVTGSFKVRGASNRLLAMSDTERARGVVAASSGNHGLGVAWAARRLGMPAQVFVPETAHADKRARIAAMGAEVQVHGHDCVLTEAHAREVATATGRTYVSPYNDLRVAAGQGTIASELRGQLPAFDRIYVALGGGGLIAGIAAQLRDGPRCEVVAAYPVASPAMAQCVQAGRIVDVPCSDTLSDSTAGGVEPGALTFGWCRELVDRFTAIGEQDIAEHLVATLHHEHLLIEGAAAVAVAACSQDRDLRGRRAVVVVCGANLPLATLRELLREH